MTKPANGDPRAAPEVRPEPGRLVRVRSRVWVVESVETGEGAAGRNWSLARLLGADDDNAERRLAVLWQNELDAQVLDEASYAGIGERGFDPRPLFAGYLRAARWNAVTATDPNLLQAPFRAGIRLDPYQLEPLAKALRLPRVNLLIADDVGLGKTIEAGLVIRELMLRRRVDLVVVTAPPAMLHQWQAELRSRFGLDTILLDRDFLRDWRRKRGFAADPWASHTRFAISHRLLIEASWTEGLRRRLGSFRPRSLLVVDEAHHAAPASGQKLAVDSQLTRALRDLAPRFEHRLFLTATPHNGHSNSFAALMEMLDPQRFVRGLEVRRSDLEPIAVRRLKADLRSLGDPGRGFPERIVEAVTIDGLPEDDPHLELGRLLARYRTRLEARVATLQSRRRHAALLVLATLQHRLLSSIAAFATTLERHERAIQRALGRSPDPSAAQIEALARRVGPTSADDAAENKPEAAEAAEDELEPAQLEAVEELSAAALARTEPSPEERELLARMREIARAARYRADRRIEWLLDWIDREACPGFRRDPERARWTHERLVVFTEWEETRRWLEGHLREAIAATDRAQDRIACFTGLTASETRRRLQDAFNEPPERNPIRVLLCTDAAREGLNLQRHCRQLLHFDLPWNPARIEQRNGRIDRKLQPAAEVYCRYFVFPQRPEDRVLAALLRKTETIRRELGPMGAVLDERLHARLALGIPHERAAELARQIEQHDLFGRAAIEEELEARREPAARERLAERLRQLDRQLERSREHLRFDPDRLRRVVDASLRILFKSRGLVPAGEAQAADGSPIPLWRLAPEDPALRGERGLARLLEELRHPPERRRERGQELRPVTFVETDRLGDDAVQLHLEHPLVKRLLARFGARGVVDHLLSRACLSASGEAEPRVLLLGRLLLYGPGAARLHEEILAVAARWIPPERRNAALQLLAEETTRRLLDRLEEGLDASPAAEVPEPVRARLKAAIPLDLEALRPALEARGRRAEERARGALAQRAERESAALRKLLDELADRLREELAEPASAQLELSLSPSERRQLEAERRAQEERLRGLEADRETEVERVRRLYEVIASRLEPLGIVYLWPSASDQARP